MTDQNLQEQQSETLSPGTILANARKKMGIELPELAEQLRVPMHVLEAIEIDKIPKNLPETFVRGYIRAYAKKVQVDENQVLKAQQTTAAFSSASSDMMSFSKRNKRKALEKRLTIVSWIIGLVLILALVIWWFQDAGGNALAPVAGSVEVTEAPASSSIEVNTTGIVPSDSAKLLSSDTQTSPSEVTAVTAEEMTSVAEPVAAVGVDVSEEPQQSEVPTDGEDSVSEVTEVVNEPAALSTAELSAANPAENTEVSSAAQYQLTAEQQALVADSGAPDEDGFVKVEMKFDELCYVEIRDVNGEAVAYGNKPKDYFMTVNAQGPLSVLLGHTHGVTVWVNGKEYDMSHLPANRVARFELEAAEDSEIELQPENL